MTTSLLQNSSRVSHYHPLRHEIPLEVLTLSLLSDPTHVRDAVHALAALHAASDRAAYYDAMTTLSPWRHSYLHAKSLSQDAFPLLAIEVTSRQEIVALEAFLGIHTNASESSIKRLDLFLQLEMIDMGMEGKADLLARIVVILEWLQGEHSRYTLKMIEIGVDTRLMGSHDLVRLTRVLNLALHDTKTMDRTFKIQVKSIGLVGEKSSFTHWGTLFQTLCCIGDEDVTEGNELCVSFAQQADPRVVAAFWSAVGFSSGYSRLNVNSADDAVGREVAKYMALAYLSPVSAVRHLNWFNCLFQQDEIDAMLQVQAASTLGELSSVLWMENGSSDAMELTVLDKSISRRFGWVLRDPVEGDLIDVFVPGFGQCSVQRQQWYTIAPCPDPECVNLFQTSKLTRFEYTLELDQRTTFVPVGLFLQMIGGTLEFIELRPWRYLCSLELVVTIFESCPSLRELAINQMQLPSRRIEVDPSRLVSTNVIKLQLLFANEPTLLTVPSSALMEAFFEVVIPVVGQQIEDLEIRKQQTGIIPFSRAFEAIASSCTRLFHLKLEHLDVQTLDPLIAAYHGGTSRISCLYLLKCPVESNALVRFAEFLADRSCKGSFKLGVLHVTHSSSNRQDAGQLHGLDAASIKAMLTMLDKNRTLSELYLCVSDASYGQFVEEPLRVYKPQFDMYDEQEIPISSEKYPIESTVAFVGVLHKSKLPYTQETVRIITKFAAERIRRSVRYDVVN